MQRQAQTHYQQQQHPFLNQEQLYGSNRQSGAMWERQHQGSYNISSSNDCTPMSQYMRDKYHSLSTSTSAQNYTRNINTEDEPPLSVGSAAEFSKMTANNKYGNNSSLEDNGYLNLMNEKSSNTTIYAEDECQDQHERNKDTDQDDTHGEER